MLKGEFEENISILMTDFFSGKAVPVAHPNIMLKKEEKGDLWCKYSVSYSPSSKPSLGCKLQKRHFGVVFIQVHVKSSTGLKIKNDLCQDIDILFENKILFNEVNFKTGNTVNTGNTEENGYYRTDLVYTFFFDEFRG